MQYHMYISLDVGRLGYPWEDEAGNTESHEPSLSVSSSLKPLHMFMHFLGFKGKRINSNETGVKAFYSNFFHCFLTVAIGSVLNTPQRIIDFLDELDVGIAGYKQRFKDSGGCSGKGSALFRAKSTCQYACYRNMTI